MGTDCKFIAKVKDKDEYDEIYLDRLYNFVGGYVYEDFPYHNNNWGTDCKEALKWCKNEIKNRINHRRDEYASNCDHIRGLKVFVEMRGHNWEKFILLDEHDEKYYTEFSSMSEKVTHRE